MLPWQSSQVPRRWYSSKGHVAKSDATASTGPQWSTDCGMAQSPLQALPACHTTITNTSPQLCSNKFYQQACLPCDRDGDVESEQAFRKQDKKRVLTSDSGLCKQQRQVTCSM